MMNVSRIALAGLGAFVAYFVLGGLTFALLPSLRSEFLKYPTIYRPQEAMKSVMPAGMAAMFVSMLALAMIYGMLYRGGSGIAEGARFDALIGVFAVGAFVVHNYVNLQIGLKLTLQQGVAYMTHCRKYGRMSTTSSNTGPFTLMMDNRALTIVCKSRVG